MVGGWLQALLKKRRRMGKEWWRGPQGVHPPPSTLTLSSEPMEVSHRVVGDQHHWVPIWAIVGFCVSWGQQPAGKGVL